MPLDRLWAGWRSAYLDVSDDVSANDGEAGSLFERILKCGRPDEETFILWRGDRCFALLNAYPYGSGHVLVMPRRAVAELEDLDAGESAELWDGVQQTVRAVKAAYRPDGVNVGLNIGTAAGAGVPDHLHLHCLPRWAGDTNFTTTVAETRVLPEPLDVSWRKLRDAWPSS